MTTFEIFSLLGLLIVSGVFATAFWQATKH